MCLLAFIALLPGEVSVLESSTSHVSELYLFPSFSFPGKENNEWGISVSSG